MELRKNRDGSISKTETFSDEVMRGHLYRQKVLLDRREKELEDLKREIAELERVIESEG